MENKNPKDYVYIAKKDTWFEEGTEAKLVADCEYFGLFKGIKRVTDDPNCPWSKSMITLGNNVGELIFDEELCGYDEFDIYEK